MPDGYVRAPVPRDMSAESDTYNVNGTVLPSASGTICSWPVGSIGNTTE